MARVTAQATTVAAARQKQIGLPVNLAVAWASLLNVFAIFMGNDSWTGNLNIRPSSFNRSE